MDEELPSLLRGHSNIESSGSLEAQINPLDPNAVFMSSAEIQDGSESAQNRYK